MGCVFGDDGSVSGRVGCRALGLDSDLGSYGFGIGV